MLNSLFPSQEKKPSSLIKRLHHTHVHHIIVFPVIILLALTIGILATTVVTQEEIVDTYIELALYIPRAKAGPPPMYLRDFTSIDVMKLTKDTVANQAGAADIKNIVTTLSQLHTQYIAISVPLDATADYKTSKPFPQTAEKFTQTWADAIHNQGLHILWRGTWSGIEGLYGFPKMVGTKRFPSGTAATAATDGNTTWLGKTYNYIIKNPAYFKDGDIWAVMPERTENIFQDSTSFLPYDGGIQTNYASFFNDLKTSSDQAFATINKKVYTGWSANNFSEIQSGWLDRSIYNTAGIVATDYYGTDHSPKEMETNLLAANHKTGKQIFLQEWSDYYNGGLSTQDRQDYLDSMYQTFQSLSDRGVLMGFNYWGGWTGGIGESIMDKTATGYKLNSRGLELQSFFENNQPK